MSLKSEILSFTTFPLSSTNILSYLTTTINLPTATAAGNNTTAALIISSAVVAAIAVVIMILLITVSIWCIIIRKRKRTEGM